MRGQGGAGGGGGSCAHSERPLNSHYFTGENGVAGFFERDGWLLEPAQLEKIKDIPTVIGEFRRVQYRGQG